MSSKVAISSCIFIYAARLKALALLLLLCLSIWGFPRSGLNVGFFFDATQLVFLGLVIVYLVLKIKSLRFVTKHNSIFSVSDFRTTDDYKEHSLVKVQVWPMRGWVWARFVFKMEEAEQVENTLTNASFLCKPNEFGVDSNLIQKMSWYSTGREEKGTEQIKGVKDR